MQFTSEVIPHQFRGIEEIVKRQGVRAAFDPNKECVAEPKKLYSKGSNNPYIGETMRGRVEFSIIGGEVICRD